MQEERSNPMIGEDCRLKELWLEKSKFNAEAVS